MSDFHGINRFHVLLQLSQEDEADHPAAREGAVEGAQRTTGDHPTNPQGPEDAVVAPTEAQRLLPRAPKRRPRSTSPRPPEPVLIPPARRSHSAPARRPERAPLGPRATVELHNHLVGVLSGKKFLSCYNDAVQDKVFFERAIELVSSEGLRFFEPHAESVSAFLERSKRSLAAMQLALEWVLEARAADGDKPPIKWHQSYSIRKLLADSYETEGDEGAVEEQNILDDLGFSTQLITSPSTILDDLDTPDLDGKLVAVRCGTSTSQFSADQFIEHYQNAVARLTEKNGNAAISVSLADGGGDGRDLMTAEVLWRAWKTLKSSGLASERLLLSFSFGSKSLIVLQKCISHLGGTGLAQEYSEIQGKLERGTSARILDGLCRRQNTRVKLLLRLDHGMMTTQSNIRSQTAAALPEDYEARYLSFLDQPDFFPTKGKSAEEIAAIHKQRVFAASVRKHLNKMALSKIVKLEGNGYIGLDINGLETPPVDKEGAKIIRDIYRILAMAQRDLNLRFPKGTMRPLVFRIHAGEGAVDGTVMSEREKEEARSSVKLLARELKRLRKRKTLWMPRQVEVRIGHCTHVDGVDLARLAKLGVVIEPNLISNRTSGVADGDWHVKAIQLHNFFARKSNAAALSESLRTRTPRKEKIRLVKYVNSSDGNGVMHSSAAEDIRLHQQVLLAALDGEEGLARVRELTPSARYQLRKQLKQESGLARNALWTNKKGEARDPDFILHARAFKDSFINQMRNNMENSDLLTADADTILRRQR